MAREHAAAKMRRPFFHAAERADIGRGERLHGRRMHLLDVACAVDLAVQHDERTLSVRFGAGGKSHGVEEVQGAVGGQRRRGTHRARQDDGLFALYDKMQEVRRLFERIRAVRDDDARRARSERRLNAGGKMQPDRLRHVLAVDGGDLLALDGADI